MGSDSRADDILSSECWEGQVKDLPSFSQEDKEAWAIAWQSL